MLRKIYTAIYYLLFPFIILRLFWRSRKAPLYRQRLLERLAIFAKESKSHGIWIHAVSLGEVIAAIPLIREFKNQYPDHSVIVTTMTPTGSERVQAVFGDKVFHVYLPYDLPSIIQRFINKVQPRLLIIMETELWPNLIHVCHKNKIPILLANARLSARSSKNYAKVKPLMQEMLNKITLIAVQTQQEAERYIQLGAPSEHIEVTGSVKFDIRVPQDQEDQAEGLRRLLGKDRSIWIAASTHQGEDEQILAAHKKILAAIPDCLLLIVPRHPERFSEVAALCRKQGYKVVLRSEDKRNETAMDVFVGDTTGELLLFYSVADVAFVAGSLMPIGGHNLLEPAALAKATITGPQMHNFVEITRLLLAADAIKQINNSDELAEAVIALLQDNMQRYQMGERALEVVVKNRGAVAKHMRLVEKLLNFSSPAAREKVPAGG